MRNPHLLCIALGLAAMVDSAPTHAAFVASLRDGLWYCTFPSSTCSFDAAVPGSADTVRIQHNVTYWGQGATPTPPLITEIAGLEVATTGFLGIYDSRTLRLLGSSVLEGGEVNMTVNGGGTLENFGTLTVSSLAGARIVGGAPINRSLWRIASGSRMDFNVGGAGFSNSQGPGGTAVFELQGTAHLQGSFFDNLSILRKTGAGTATVIASMRSTVEGADGGNIEVTGGELLLTSQVSP